MMQQKHAIITGASRGIGLALAERLAQQNVVVSNLSRSAGPVGQHFPCDMRQNPARALELAIAANGPPDILILNAGMALPETILASDQDDYRNHMEVNFFAAVDLTRVAIPHLPKGGRIVFIGSGAAFFGIQGHGAYVASKFALRGFAEAMRGELKPKGIVVSLVHPPNVDTDMFHAEEKLLSPETLAITGSARMVSPDYVADRVMKSLKNNRFDVPIGMPMRLLNRWHSMIKPQIFAVIDRKATGVRKK